MWINHEIGLAEGHWKHWSKNSPYKTLTCTLTLKAWCTFVDLWCIDDTKISWCKDAESHRHRLFLKKKYDMMILWRVQCRMSLWCLSRCLFCSFKMMFLHRFIMSFSKIRCVYALILVWHQVMWLSAPPTWVCALSGPDGLSDTGLNH